MSPDAIAVLIVAGILVALVVGAELVHHGFTPTQEPPLTPPRKRGRRT